MVEGRLDAARQREIGFPWSPQMVERSRRSVGATIAAARTALTEGVAANLAGGTHHAYADRGSGYCVFNDAAVAARLMQAEWHRSAPRRIARRADRPRRAPGQRQRGDLPRRPDGVHAVDARRAQLPVSQGSERSRRRTARRLRRRRLPRPRWTARSPRSGSVTPKRRPASSSISPAPTRTRAIASAARS